MTTSESASFALLDGESSAVQTLGLKVVPTNRRSRTRFWIVVAIEVLLLATILGFFVCHSRNELRPAPAPRDVVPTPLG